MKESMKFYFLIPGKELVNDFMFLGDDSSCVRIAEYIPAGSVADVYVEYHGEEEHGEHSTSSSDFEEEINAEEDSEEEPDAIITAPEEEQVDVLITDDAGVIKEVIRSPVKKQCRRIPLGVAWHDQVAYSQVLDPS